MTDGPASVTPSVPASPALTAFVETMTLQRRVIAGLALQEKAAQDAVEQQRAVLRVAVDKLLRGEGGTAALTALADAAWETGGDSALHRLLRGAQAQIDFRGLTRRHGDQAAVQSAYDKDLERFAVLQPQLAAREKQLAVWDDRLRAYDRGGTYQMRELEAFIKKNGDAAVKLAEVSIFSSREMKELKATADRYSAQYTPSDAGLHNRVSIVADLRDRAVMRGERDEIVKEMDSLKAALLPRAAALDSMRRLSGRGGHVAQDVPFKEMTAQLCEALKDGKFMASVGRHLPQKLSAPLLLVAVKAEAVGAMGATLAERRAEAEKTLETLRGPVATLARERIGADAIADAARDVKLLAALGGYICLSAADTLGAVASFNPEDVEGAQSARRALQMHAVTAGNVDPAFLCESMGMDGTMAAHYGIDPLMNRPALAKVLADASAVARDDRKFADFLQETAGDPDLQHVRFGRIELDDTGFWTILEIAGHDSASDRLFGNLRDMAKETVNRAAVAAGLRQAPPPAPEPEKPALPQRRGPAGPGSVI